MAFKGTKTRTARGIAEEIEAVGGHLNAHTSREFTAFHATVLKADVELAVDIIGDILQNSVFDEAELARERVVIAQEIGEAADIPDDVIFDDMVVSAAGNLDPARFVAMVEKRFAGLPSHAPENATARAAYKGGEFREIRDLEQAHLVLGFDIYSRAASYTDTGLFGVYAGTGEEQLAALMPLVCDELNKVMRSVTSAEVARARAQMKAGMLMSLESTYSRCEQLARQMHIFGRPLDISEIVAKIDAVDETAVRRAAARIIASRPTLSALGPVATLEAFDKIAARF
jgi:predicted Zn-dependent peptidase